MPLLGALHLRRSEPASTTASPGAPHQLQQPFQPDEHHNSHLSARNRSTPSPLMASTSSNTSVTASLSGASSPGSTVRTHGVDFELLPSSPPSRSHSVTRTWSKRRLKSSSTNSDSKRSGSKDFAETWVDPQSHGHEELTAHPTPDRLPPSHRSRAPRPPLLRRASSDPDLQAIPNNYLNSRRPSAPPAPHYVSASASASAAAAQHHLIAQLQSEQPPVLAATPPRHFRRSRTPTQTPSSHTLSQDHGGATSPPPLPLPHSSHQTPKVPPRLSARPAHLTLHDAPTSRATATAEKGPPDSVVPSSSTLSMQLLARNQQQSAEVDLTHSDSATLVIDSNEPLQVEYKTVAIPGSSAKRWVLHFKKSNGATSPSSLPLSPPNSAGSKTNRSATSPNGLISPSLAKPSAVEDLFYEPSTPTRAAPRARTPSPSPGIRGHGKGSGSSGSGHGSDSDGASAMSSPHLETPRPSISGALRTPQTKQEGFALHEEFSKEDVGSLHHQHRDHVGQYTMATVPPLALNTSHTRPKHVPIASTDTLSPTKPAAPSAEELPGDEYYGDVLGFFLAQPKDDNEEEEDDGLGGIEKPLKGLSLAQRRGLKDPNFKLGLNNLGKSGDEEVSRWSETESDDNDG